MPALAAVAIIYYFAPGNAAFDLNAASNTVAWSWLAEVIYYGAYPLLFTLARRWGWSVLAACAFAAALALTIASPRLPYLPSFGPYE